MASTTLLDVVQSILSDANGDEVSSLGDTVEATQCANIVANVYEDIAAEYDIQAVKRLFKLDGDADTDSPCHMRIPEEFHSVEWIKYDRRLNIDDAQAFTDVTYLYPKDFMDMVNQRLIGATNVTTSLDPSGVLIHVLDNQAPTYYTLFDDRHLVFDSYNASVEATLHQAKTQAYGQTTNKLVIADATVITLPPELVPLLVNEARAMFFDVHAGGATQRIERRASRSRVRVQRIRHTMRNNKEQFKHTGPNYGRRC
jgi:hypothetical protein